MFTSSKGRRVQYHHIEASIGPSQRPYCVKRVGLLIATDGPYSIDVRMPACRFQCLGAYVYPEYRLRSMQRGLNSKRSRMAEDFQHIHALGD